MSITSPNPKKEADLQELNRLIEEASRNGIGITKVPCRKTPNKNVLPSKNKPKPSTFDPREEAKKLKQLAKEKEEAQRQREKERYLDIRRRNGY